MADENNDANNEENAGSSPDVQLEPLKTDEGLISTTEFVEVKKDEPEEDADTSDDAEQNTSKTESEEEEKKDFHDHPRFQELIKERDSYKKKAEQAEIKKQEIATFNQSLNAAPKQEAAFSKMMAMSPDQLLENMTENPHQFFSNFAQQQAAEIENKIMGTLSNQQKQAQVATLQNRQLATFNKFFESNPEAKEMFESGELTTFMNENPGHNAISAYQTINSENIIKSATEKAVADALENQTKKLKAAGNAGSFSSTTTQPSISTKDPELKNPDKHGGKSAVMLKRWLGRSA